MQPDTPLPPFSCHGYLPEGVHETTLECVRERFVINPRRVLLWQRLEEFLQGQVSAKHFSHIYIDGGFITNKPAPEDIDVILQPIAPFGAEAFSVLVPFFGKGSNEIYEKYSVHLHFWCEGFPDGANDFRQYFQYMRPQDAAPLGLREGTRKGIVRIKL